MGFDVHLIPTRAGAPREVVNPFTREHVMTRPMEMSDDERARVLEAVARHGGRLDARGSGVVSIEGKATVDMTALGMAVVRGDLEAACRLLFDVAHAGGLVAASDAGPSLVTSAETYARVNALCAEDPALRDVLGDELEVVTSAAEMATHLRASFDQAVAYSRHAMDAE